MLPGMWSVEESKVIAGSDGRPCGGILPGSVIKLPKDGNALHVACARSGEQNLCMDGNRGGKESRADSSSLQATGGRDETFMGWII
ncbi:hypothetical protein OIU76_013469 [Salix suchowensis]|nr:hypothetical protein OIU76_013469 [Salix suchowensis]